MKRMIPVFLIILSLTVFASAFGGEKTVLRFSWWGGNERHEATLAAIKAFEAANPDVEIKAEYMGWDGYLERLTTQIGAGSEPDVMQIDWAWLAMFSKDGNGFYDLNRQRGKVGIHDEYDKQWLDSGSVAGKLNAIPVSFTALVVAYNKDIWNKAGLALPKTWDELVAVGKSFHEILGPDYYPLDMNWNEVVYFTHAYIFQKTGRQYLWPDRDEVALTREELMDWLDCYRRMVASGTLMSLERRTAIGGDSERQSQEFKEFIDGEWAGAMTFDAALSNRLSTVRQNFEFVIGDFPTMDGAKSSGRVGRPAMLFAVAKNSRNADAAARFIEFMLCTETAAKILKSTRGALLSRTGYSTLVDEGLIDPINQTAMDQVRGVRCHTPNPYFEHARTKELMRQAFEGVGYGKLTIEEGADMLLDEGNRLVGRLGR